MRKSDFEVAHEEFEAWIKFYDEILTKLIGAKKVISERFMKLELIEAVVLRWTVRWERLIVSDIITSLNRNSSQYAKELGLRLRKHLTRDEAEGMLLGHRFIDFRSVNELKSFGKRYLVAKYNPFKAISSDVGDKIDQIVTMRNYLAHYSSKAWRTYKEMMRKKYRLKRISEPGTFLISINRKTGCPRWCEYLMNFYKCSQQMRGAVP